MSEETNEQQQGPVKTFRQGGVAASIWRRERPDGSEYFDFSMSRSWRSHDGKQFGYSSNFFASNEAELTTVIEDACQWIADRQDNPSDSAKSPGGTETEPLPTAA